MTEEHLSICCGAHVKIVGGAGCNYYTCEGCGKPCGTDDDGEREQPMQRRKRESENKDML